MLWNNLNGVGEDDWLRGVFGWEGPWLWFCGVFFGLGFVVIKGLCVSVFWFVILPLVELCLLRWCSCMCETKLY